LTRALFVAAIGVTLLEAEQTPEHLLAETGSLAGPMRIPVAKGTTATVFRAEAGRSGFNLHSYFARFDGKFWAVWSSSKVGEEDPDQHIRYAAGADGRTWSAFSRNVNNRS
jgi:hypothetical protein